MPNTSLKPSEMVFGLRVNRDALRRFRHAAQREHRSATGQLNVLIDEYVRRYEHDHPGELDQSVDRDEAVA